VIAENAAGRRGGGVHSTGYRAVVRVLEASTVTGNTAGIAGGGIFDRDEGVITVDATSGVSGNIPDDCVGTGAC
jgi:hypothetical protein